MSCDACKSGHLHEGIPTGSFVTIAGIDTYVAEPESFDGKGTMHNDIPMW